jgi:hypothetical protein
VLERGGSASSAVAHLLPAIAGGDRLRVTTRQKRRSPASTHAVDRPPADWPSKIGISSARSRLTTTTFSGHMTIYDGQDIV